MDFVSRNLFYHISPSPALRVISIPSLAYSELRLQKEMGDRLPFHLRIFNHFNTATHLGKRLLQTRKSLYFFRVNL